MGPAPTTTIPRRSSAGNAPAGPPSSSSSKRCWTPIPGTVSPSSSLSHPRFYSSMELSYTVMAWDYRRYVLASSPDRKPASTELDYTTRKIESNFSNFSAWHQRSKVLGSLWAKGEQTTVAVKDAGEHRFYFIFTFMRCNNRLTDVRRASYYHSLLPPGLLRI